MRTTSKGSVAFGPSDHVEAEASDLEVQFIPGTALNLGLGKTNDPSVVQNYPLLFKTIRAKVYNYETQIDALGREFVLRTDVETGLRQRFVLPPSISFDSEPF